MFIGVFHSCQFNRRQTYIIWAERRSGCEYAHSFIAAKFWRLYCCTPVLPFGFMEFPQDPDVGEILQPPEGFRLPVFRQKNDRSGQFIHQTALSGNPKFFLKICIYVSDDIHDAFILPFKNGIVSAVHSNMNIFYFP